MDPLFTAATNKPIVPAPGEYDGGDFDGMVIENLPRAYLPTTNATWLPGRKHGSPRWEAND
jgi:hypothetical protein